MEAWLGLAALPGHGQPAGTPTQPPSPALHEVGTVSEFTPSSFNPPPGVFFQT